METEEKKIYDFYFSEKHKQRKIELSRYKPTYFNGVEYTEAAEEWQAPHSWKCGDLVLIGKGTIKESNN